MSRKVAIEIFTSKENIMRALTVNEIDRIAGGLRKKMPTRMRTMANKPSASTSSGGGVDWGGIQVDSSWWGGDASGSWAGTNSFSFFGADPGAPSTHFFFNETNGIGKLSVATPNVNGGGAVPLGTYQGTPNGSDLEFGVEGSWTLSNGMSINVNGGVFTADPRNPHATVYGAKFTVKW